MIKNKKFKRRKEINDDEAYFKRTSAKFFIKFLLNF